MNYINSWELYKKLLASMLLVFLALFYLAHFIAFIISGPVTIDEPNKVMLWSEMILLVSIVTLAMDCFIRDIRKNTPKNNKEGKQMAALTETQYQQILEYRHTLIDMQVKLDKLHARPSEMIPAETPVETIREVPVIIEVERKVSQGFREFEDLMELKGWLERNSLAIALIADKNGRVDLFDLESTSQNDCDDYAEALPRKALEQGLLMSQQPILNGKIYGVKVPEITEPHYG